jgi:hypothetical protein
MVRLNKQSLRRQDLVFSYAQGQLYLYFMCRSHMNLQEAKVDTSRSVSASKSDFPLKIFKPACSVNTAQRGSFPL